MGNDLMSVRVCIFFFDGQIMLSIWVTNFAIPLKGFRRCDISPIDQCPIHVHLSARLRTTKEGSMPKGTWVVMVRRWKRRKLTREHETGKKLQGIEQKKSSHLHSCFFSGSLIALQTVARTLKYRRPCRPRRSFRRTSTRPTRRRASWPTRGR